MIKTNVQFPTILGWSKQSLIIYANHNIKKNRYKRLNKTTYIVTPWISKKKKPYTLQVLFFLASKFVPSLSVSCASLSMPSLKRHAAWRYKAEGHSGEITWACIASPRASCAISFIKYDRQRRAYTVGDTIVPHSMNYRKTRRQQISHNLKTNLCFQTKLIKVTCSLKAWLLCISPRFNPRARTHLCIGIDCSCVVFCSKSRICTLLRIW